MKRIALCIALMSVVAAGPGLAACYADYKAKKDGGPLRLHYGVVELPNGACNNMQRAEQQVRRRLEDAGWRLLTVVSVFDESGLAQRKDSAADFFLRF